MYRFLGGAKSFDKVLEVTEEEKKLTHSGHIEIQIGHVVGELLVVCVEELDFGLGET